MSTSLKSHLAGLAAVAVLLLAGCAQSTNPASAASQPPVAAAAANPPQLVAARTAFWPMYTAAHQWSPDVILLRVTARQLTGYKNQSGKAGQWEAAFGSPRLHQYRVFTYSIATVPPAFKGVSAGLALPWGGVTRDAMPVDLTLVNVDSDAAYQAAAADAAPWLKKNPGKELTAFEIGDTWHYQVPVWYVTWGNKQAGYAALVDASSGKVLKHK